MSLPPSRYRARCRAHVATDILSHHLPNVERLQEILTHLLCHSKLSRHPVVAAEHVMRSMRCRYGKPRNFTSVSGIAIGRAKQQLILYHHTLNFE